MHEYEHTQAGTLMQVVLGGGAIASTAIGAVFAMDKASLPKAVFGPLLVAVVLFVFLLLFYSLTVKVSSDCIMIKFGIGLIRKRFDPSMIKSSEIVRNHWYYGWGVKLIQHGWLYNVSGFDAVEIRMVNGRRYRIGTDEPDKLLAAIRNHPKTGKAL